MLILTWRRTLLWLTLLGLLTGAIAWASGRPEVAKTTFGAATAIAVPPLVVSLITGLRHGRVGVDLIALLALLGALSLKQYVAGAIIALMFATGLALEDYAGGRARRELRALVERAPRIVHRYEGGALVTLPVESVRPGDLLLVRSGEVIPIDGVIERGQGVLDESALTGEPIPVERGPGERIRSGTVSVGPVFDLWATTTADESTYAGIVRLVREAHAAKAPFVRLADRFALLFVPVTLALAAAAWLTSANPIRALAVLVVATPCPLILAAPVAIVSGISQAARKGVIVKNGAALEALGKGTVLLIDKTGTLTAGRPVVSHVEILGYVPPDEVLRLAASLDQASGHVLAAAIVEAARSRGLRLSIPGEIFEDAGKGIRGLVDGKRVALGKASWACPDGDLTATDAVRRRADSTGSSSVFVSIDDRLAGALVLDDPVRVDTPETIQALRQAGIKRIVIVTGDHPAAAHAVGSAIEADAVLAERSPAEKIAAVKAERGSGTTIMVGDGINDAPALAAADVGVALGARGATASSEAADVVLTADRLDRLADAVRFARSARRIALQSVVAGMSLSLAAMAVAAAGFLPPVAGAFLQEVIDVAVIANALRALGGPPPAARKVVARLPHSQPRRAAGLR